MVVEQPRTETAATDGEVTYLQAIHDALWEELERLPTMVVLGEDIQEGGVFRVTDGMLERFGPQRILDTPLAESSIVGIAIGLATNGCVPVAEIQFADFAYLAFDQLINNAGCIRYMSGGLIHCPIVIRGPANGGTNVGATHSHTPENFCANVPGLKVIAPATAYDAKGLMKSAIRDNDPVYVMENTLLYGVRGEVPEGEYTIPLGKADVKRAGSNVSLIAHGRCVLLCLEAAETLAREHGIDAEVVDLRSLRPLDEETVLESVKKTNRAVVVEENKPYCGVGAQIASMIQEKAFDSLDAPVLRVSSIDAPACYSPPVEQEQLPNPRRIVAKVLEIA